MVDVMSKEEPKVEAPATHFDKPQDIVQDKKAKKASSQTIIIA